MRSRSTIRIIVLLVAVGALVIALAACSTGFKPGSLAVSQPGGVGSVRIHLVLCTEAEASGSEPCETTEESRQGQRILAFAVPSGSHAPQTVTAVPRSGGAAIGYSLDPEAAAVLAAGELMPASQEGEGITWPPAGSEIVAYISGVLQETPGEHEEWTIDADFGLPDAADGGSYSGPFVATVVTGLRLVDGEYAASRPYQCLEGEPPGEMEALCGINAQAQTNVSDLKIAPPAAVHSNAGETASIPFSFDFASTASPLPIFALSATTSLPGAVVALPEAFYAPPAVSGAAHRAPLTARSVTVAIPAGAAAGNYEVTITAKTAAGGTVSRAATLSVAAAPPVLVSPAAATMKLGKAKLDKRRGTATVAVALSAPGTLTVTGKKIARVRRRAAAAKTVKVTIEAKGKAKRALGRKGKAKVKASFRFQPSAGAAIAKAKSITLKKRRAHHRHR